MGPSSFHNWKWCALITQGPFTLVSNLSRRTRRANKAVQEKGNATGPLDQWAHLLCLESPNTVDRLVHKTSCVRPRFARLFEVMPGMPACFCAVMFLFSSSKQPSISMAWPVMDIWRHTEMGCTNCCVIWGAPVWILCPDQIGIHSCH